MSNPKIEFVETIDNCPGEPNGWGGDYIQGTTWTNWRVFKLTDAAGNITYFKTGVTYDSYGSADGAADPVLCTPVTRTVTAWE